MLPEIAREELIAVLETVALDLLAEAGIEQPPIDALRLAGALSITVALDERQLGRARFVRLAGHRGEQSRPTILLRPDPRPERRQWAVAHEIGEHAAWRVFEALGVDPRETTPLAREEVANHLANRLLLPGLLALFTGLTSPPREANAGGRLVFADDFHRSPGGCWSFPRP